MTKLQKQYLIKAPLIAGAFIICTGIANPLRADEAEDMYYTRGMRADSKVLFEENRKRGDADAALYLGRLSMLEYDFPAAQKHYSEYRTLKKKARQTVDPVIEDEEAALKEGKILFDRVRELAVIDEVEVDKDTFYKYLRLPLTAGRVVDASTLPIEKDGVQIGPTGYISESGDIIMWSAEDEESGLMRIFEANVLTDGTLSDPVMTPEFLGNGGDAINPFLSADGTTLYYVSNGEGSMGGYDIFMATRDPQTGEYLQPVNLGIPFNSYGDEYLLAIDEENGVGWWATDRHYLPDDKIVLYLFEWTGDRKNIDASDEEKRKRSRLENIRDTWMPISNYGADGDDDEEDEETDASDEEEEGAIDPQSIVRKYEALAAEIRKIQPGQKPRREECRIPLGKGKYIYSADDVKGNTQKALVDEYVVRNRNYEKKVKELAMMRKEYAKHGSSELGSRITVAEKEVQKEHLEMVNLLSRLYKSLGTE